MSTPSFYARLSFQAKVLIPVVAVMVLLIAAIMWQINLRFTRQFQAQAAQQLAMANDLFTDMRQLMNDDNVTRFRRNLNDSVLNARMSSGLKATIETGDSGTIRYCLEQILLTEKTLQVMVFTPDPGADFAPVAATNSQARLDVREFVARSSAALQATPNRNPARAVVLVGGKLYEVIALPCFRGEMTFGVELGADIASRIKQRTQSEILFANDNQVLARPGLNASLVGAVNDLLRASGLAEGSRQLELAGHTYLCKFVRLEASSPGAGPGFVLLTSLDGFLRELRSTQQILLWVSLLGVLAGTLAVWAAVNRVTAPLRQLRKGVEAVGRGDFSRRVQVDSRDECGELAGVFNQMAVNLQVSHEELERTLERLRATQHQLVQSEKLSGIGEFVAGVAHELNNPLTTVMGFSELLHQDQQLPDNQRRFLDMIFKSAKRCQKIVASLLSFARRHAPERKVVCVNEVVESAVEILAYQMRTSGIEVSTTLDPRLPATSIDAHQMQQVFLNIINNARQAMEGRPGTGRLNIATESGPGCVRIIFRDNGPGIPPENLSKIFNPFFTTKEVGKGTGLGLSLCYGIVSEHGGTITPHSRPGEGATFIVELPVTTESAPKAENPRLQTPLPDTREGAGKRVLVIDDEESILQMVRAALTRSGYDVDIAGDGETALDRLRQTNYDLALCDWKMPGLNGRQVYERLSASNPEMSRRLIFMTGDVVNENTQAFLTASNKICLSKPFTLAEFRAALTRILTPA